MEHRGKTSLCALPAAVGAAAKAAGASAGEEAIKEAGKSAVKYAFAAKGPEKDPVVFFGLFCSFKELPSFDTANSQLGSILSRLDIKGQEIEANKQTFRISTSWEEFEGCEVPEDAWELDTYQPINKEDEENIDWSLASMCVEQLTVWLAPLSQSKKEEIIGSAYGILDDIRRKLYDTSNLTIKKISIFGFIRTDQSTCIKIEKKFEKKLKANELTGNVYIESIPEHKKLMTVPIREKLYALALADSFKRWGGR